LRNQILNARLNPKRIYNPEKAKKAFDNTPLHSTIVSDAYRDLVEGRQRTFKPVMLKFK